MSKIKFGKLQRIEEKHKKKASDYDKVDLRKEKEKMDSAAFRESVTRYTSPEEYANYHKFGSKVRF
jgi:hypothetical protein